MNLKKTKSCCLAVACIALMFLASAVFAQQGGGAGGSQPNVVGEMDKDNDGKVTKSEWKGDPKAFSKYDKNGDGSLAKDEWPSGLPTMDLLDKNGDGKVTPDEFPASAPEGMFKQFDRDGNGSLTESELSPPTSGGGQAPSGSAPAGK